MPKHLAIIGAGIIGMTLALRLSSQGYQVTLIEADDEIGGLLRPQRIGEYSWDRFYHVICLSDSNLLGLLRELGLKDHIHRKPTKTGFFAQGRLYSLSNIVEFLAFPPLKLIDKMRLAWTIFYVSKIKSWRRLERVLVSDWLNRLSGHRTFEKIWLPLLRSKLGDNYRIANAAFIWAIIARMYAARRSGMKQEMFGYIDGGYATVLDRFQHHLESLGVEILLNSEVKNAFQENGNVVVGTAQGISHRFHTLIFTIPSPHIPDICPQLSAAEQTRMEAATYQGVISAALILRKPLAEYYITNITDPWVPFTAVIEMTALIDKKCFDGHSLVYLPRYLAQGDPYWTLSDAEVESEFLSALERMYPDFRKGDVLHIAISKASHVLPVTTLDYSSEMIPPTGTTLDDVFLVNSAQIPNGTMNVNELVHLANRKADEIAKLLCT